MTVSKPLELTTNTEYAIGAIIAGLIFSYLLYALLKAENF